MSGVLKRTIFVHQDKDKVLFHDWARVITGLGTMVEPRCFMALRPVDGSVSATGALSSITDDISRMDDIEAVHIGKEQMVLSDTTDSIAVHGGAQWPRSGY